MMNFDMSGVALVPPHVTTVEGFSTWLRHYPGWMIDVPFAHQFGQGPIVLQGCPLCGAMVGQHQVHIDWHSEIWDSTRVKDVVMAPKPRTEMDCGDTALP